MFKKQAGRLFKILIGRNLQQVSPALPLAPPEELNVFLHIPKTAGTYFNSIMMENLPGIFHDHIELAIDNPSQFAARCPPTGVLWLSGHVRRSQCAAKLDYYFSQPQAHYYTLLRHPLHQFISQLSWQINVCLKGRQFLWGHSVRSLEVILSTVFADLSSDAELARLIKIRPRHFDNNQCQMLSIEPLPDIQSPDSLNTFSRLTHAGLLLLQDFAVEQGILPFIARCLGKPVEGVKCSRVDRNESICPLTESLVQSDHFLEQVVRTNTADFVLYLNALSLSNDRASIPLSWNSTDDFFEVVRDLCRRQPYRSVFDPSVQQAARDAVIAYGKAS